MKASELRFAYNTNGLQSHRLADALELMAAAGYRGVALTLDHMHLDPLAATTAEVEPAEDPLEPSSGFQGLLVMPPNHSSPSASVPTDNLATSTAPASSKRWATVAKTSSDWS